MSSQVDAHGNVCDAEVMIGVLHTPDLVLGPDWSGVLQVQWRDGGEVRSVRVPLRRLLIVAGRAAQAVERVRGWCRWPRTKE